MGALQMEVGIEDCLHIEFEYDKGRYHLKDTVVGKIYFLLVSNGPYVKLEIVQERHSDTRCTSTSQKAMTRDRPWLACKLIKQRKGNTGAR